MSLLRKLFGPYKEEVWRQLAADYDGIYREGGWRSSDKVCVYIEPWEIILDTFTVKRRKSRETYTRIRAPFRNTDDFYFKIYHEHFFHKAAKYFGMQDIEIGDPEFEVPRGEVHCISAKINADNMCGDASATATTQYVTNVGPYDPNDIRVFNQAGHQAMTYDTTEWQYYHIRFQNTGTDTAFDARVLTAIDDSLDLSTLELLGSSHDYRPDFNDAQDLVMHFDNIMLPDSNVNLVGSNGYFKFRIKPIKNATYGTALECYSDIYFDYNDAVRTNTSMAILGKPCGALQYAYNKYRICDNDLDALNEIGYNREGRYQRYKSNNGCDTLEVLDLTLLDTPFTSENITSCVMDTSELFDRYSVFDTLQTVFGCDSIHRATYYSYLLDTLPRMYSRSLCEGEESFGQTETGIYQDTVRSGNKCIIRIYDLTFEDIYADTISQVLCKGDSLNGYSTSGTFSESYTTVENCDSIIVYDITVLPMVQSVIDTAICDGETFMEFDESGSYTRILMLDESCENQTINLQVHPPESELCMSTSTSQLKISDWHIFPNPVSEQLFIEGRVGVAFDIINPVGKIVRSGLTQKNTTIDMRDILSGIYFLRVQDDTQVWITTFVKL